MCREAPEDKHDLSTMLEEVILDENTIITMVGHRDFKEVTVTYDDRLQIFHRLSIEDAEQLRDKLDKILKYLKNDDEEELMEPREDKEEVCTTIWDDSFSLRDAIRGAKLWNQ